MHGSKGRFVMSLRFVSLGSLSLLALGAVLLSACGDDAVIAKEGATTSTTTTTATTSAGGSGQGGAGGATGLGGAGGATGQGGAGGAGGATGAGGWGAPGEPRSFSVTITNTSGASLFIPATGGAMPFHILDGASKELPTGTQCDCAVCHVGPSCTSNDWLSTAVEIPAGESAVVTADLTWFVEEPIVEETCEFVTGFDTCGLAQAFAAGGYTLNVAYGTQANMDADGFAPTDQTQWGQKLWRAGSPFVGGYPSTAGTQFTIGAGAVTVTANIGGK
jgi:hypothetical protein